MTETLGLTEKQRKARKKGLGGSDIGAMLGLSRWKTPVDLWMEKTGRTVPEDIGHRPEVHFGNVLERVVCEEFERRTGVELEEVGLAVHPEYPYMLGRADRWVARCPTGEPAGFEAKTASAWLQQDWGESQETLDDERDDVPLFYLTQVVHYMEVYQVEKWYLAVLIGGNDFRWYTIRRNADLAQELLRREAEFWAHVEHDTPPEVTSLADVLTLYPRDTRPAIAASDQVMAWMEKLAGAQDAIKRWKEVADQSKMRIADYMGENAVLLDRAGTKLVSFKAHKTKRLNTKRLKAEKPEVYDEYVEEHDVRPFRLS